MSPQGKYDVTGIKFWVQNKDFGRRPCAPTNSPQILMLLGMREGKR